MPVRVGKVTRRPAKDLAQPGNRRLQVLGDGQRIGLGKVNMSVPVAFDCYSVLRRLLQLVLVCDLKREAVGVDIPEVVLADPLRRYEYRGNESVLLEDGDCVSQNVAVRIIESDRYRLRPEKRPSTASSRETT